MTFSWRLHRPPKPTLKEGGHKLGHDDIDERIDSQAISIRKAGHYDYWGRK